MKYWSIKVETASVSLGFTFIKVVAPSIEAAVAYARGEAQAQGYEAAVITAANSEAVEVVGE